MQATTAEKKAETAHPRQQAANSHWVDSGRRLYLALLGGNSMWLIATTPLAWQESVRRRDSEPILNTSSRGNRSAVRKNSTVRQTASSRRKESVSLNGLRTLGVLFFVSGLCGRSAGADPVLNPTPLKQSQLDNAAFAEWLAGHDKSAIPTDRARTARVTSYGLRSDGPMAGGPLWHRSRAGGATSADWLYRAHQVCTVLVRACGLLSVLKAEAKYPGDMGDDSQWITAERFSPRQPAGVEYSPCGVCRQEPNTGLRSTHVADVAADQTPWGWMGEHGFWPSG